VYHAYHALVLSWLQQYAGCLDTDERMSAANEVWARFARQMSPDKLAQFLSWPMVLQYLKRCAISVAIGETPSLYINLLM
jgi:hypothetical protein